MKRLLCLGAFVVLSICNVYANEDTKSDPSKTMLVQNTPSALKMPHLDAKDAIQNPEFIKHYWSYSALAQTMKDLRTHCEPTRKDEFLAIGNWARENNATFSLAEIIWKCEATNPEPIIRSNEHPCHFPQETQCKLDENQIPLSCGEKNLSKNKWCNIFISTLVENHNKVVEKLGDTKPTPGTYVEKVSITMHDGTHRNAYKVVDVVLSDDYYANGSKKYVLAAGDLYTKHINQTANQADENTAIWERTPDGGIIKVPNCRTWTNDMFMDIQASSHSIQGDVRGAAFESYIFCDEDVTQYVYEKYDKRRGIMGASVANAFDSIDGNDFDIKVALGKEYTVSGQTNKTPQANGVLFNGRVASIDFLGNMLYGMNREEAVLPNIVADDMADLVSIGSAKLSALKNADTKGLLKDKIIEPETVRNAWDIGGEFVKRATFDYEFKNTQTQYEHQAYSMAQERMTAVYNAVAPIKCSGNCNPRGGSDDVVICTDANGMRREFIFDDICDGRSLRQIYQAESAQYESLYK